MNYQETLLAFLLLFTVSSFADEGHPRQSSNHLTDQLRRVVKAHYSAIEENRLDEAMFYYHSQSPEIENTKGIIEFGLSQYLLKTTIMDFCYGGQQGHLTLVTAKQRYLMIVGVKFIEHSVNAVYLLRQEEGNWKIWSQRDDPGGVNIIP